MKRIISGILIMILVLSLCSCGHKHSWTEATCTEPKTCSKCGEKEGEPLGHDWKDATCTEPKTCAICGLSEGEPLGHDWKDATCTEPKTCAVCGLSEGEPLGHSWKDATCTEPQICARCGEKEGEPIGHTPGEWSEDELIIGAASVQKCTICGEIIAEKEFDRSGKTARPLFTSKGFSMTVNEFGDHLIHYLPNDVVLSFENIYNDDAPWFRGSMIAITSSDLQQKSRYIRMWYAQGKDLYESHIDAYFENASDFTDIAECVFSAIDPEYAKSAAFPKDLETITGNMQRKTTWKNHVELNDCFFLYYYTSPYTIGETRYPGFFAIRFLSKPFFKDHYQ